MEILNRSSKYSQSACIRVRPDVMLKPQSLDFFLKYSKKHPIPRPEAFRQKLLALLKHKPRPGSDTGKIAKILARLPNLKKDPEMGIAAICKVADALCLRAIPPVNREMRLNCESYYKSRVLQCLTLKALISVMPRQKALKYFETLLDERYKVFKPRKMKSVKQMLDLQQQVKRGPLKDGAIFVQAVTDDGRAVMKITRCRPAQVLLREVKDPQIVHAVICQPDFGWARRHNPAFELTREKSLVLGMPYCGHIWHDRRVHKNIKHPPRKFWEALK